jgi:phosphoribosylformimino-5-aminoimidazole carboxamide ribotide isomerase
VFEVIPAIDLRDGNVVNLRRGRFDESTIYSEDPVLFAKAWVDAGAKRLHIVDLDGALSGVDSSVETVRAIRAAYPALTIQVGGGIRSLETIERYLAVGIDYVILGTRAVEAPDFVDEACAKFKGQIIVGLDAEKGRVAIRGGKEVTDQRAEDLALRFEQSGVAGIVYTDIDRDGMMAGTNVLETMALAAKVDIPIIASGGIHTLEDVKQLLPASNAARPLAGVITGRAIYEGTLDLGEALRLAAA